MIQESGFWEAGDKRQEARQNASGINLSFSDQQSCRPLFSLTLASWLLLLDPRLVNDNFYAGNIIYLYLAG